ncbi:probable F-actin-capping protein subunit beta [Tanacetum coccineum]
MKNELVDYGIRNADVISVLLEICILCVLGLLNCDIGEVVQYAFCRKQICISANSVAYDIVLCDEDSAKEFILCEYNRDADSYRSPWLNKFHPHLEDGMYPSEELRKLEVKANEVFTIYRDQYYEGGILSVYLWEEDDNEGFVACFLIKKDSDTSGTLNLSGSIRRQIHSPDKSRPFSGRWSSVQHGEIIEELEGKLRNQLDQVYFGMTKEMVCTLRLPSEMLSMTLLDSRNPSKWCGEGASIRRIQLNVYAVLGNTVTDMAYCKPKCNTTYSINEYGIFIRWS